MRTARLSVFVAYVLFIRGPVFADFDSATQGTASANFLQLLPGAKERAMGHSGAATSESPNSLYWNPSRIGESGAGSASFSHAAYLEGVRTNDGVVSFPLRGKSGVAVGLRFFQAGSIERTDDTGQSVGSFSPKDYLATAGAGVPVGPVRAGIALKLIRSEIVQEASAVAADASVTYEYAPTHTAAAFIWSNRGEKLKFQRESEPLPETLRLGICQKIGKTVTATVDNIARKRGGIGMAAGVEWTPIVRNSFLFGFRGGFNTFLSRSDFSGFSGGFGLDFIGKWSLDYAFLPLGDLGLTHYVTTSWRFRRHP